MPEQNISAIIVILYLETRLALDLMCAIITVVMQLSSQYILGCMHRCKFDKVIDFAGGIYQLCSVGFTDIWTEWGMLERCDL